MAIRFCPSPIASVVQPAVLGGWRLMTVSGFTGGTAGIQVVAVGQGFFQPSALSRPGNLGTAYVGVWTGNIS